VGSSLRSVGWHLVICTPDNLGNTGSGDTANTGAG
jgi:hypothetical protein